MSLCKMYITEKEWDELKKDFKEPNYNLIKDFLKKENPECYDFKLENSILKDEKEVLLRELTFKKNPGGFDPDCSVLCMSIQCALLEAKDINVKGYSGRTIVVFRDERYEMLETDTINSFWTLYKRVLTTEVPKYTEKCKSLGIKGGLKDNLDIAINNIRGNGVLDIKNYNSAIAEEIIKFASLNHSIGNFLIGPNGFNCKDDCSKAKLFSNRNWSSFDRIDLFLESLENSIHQDWYEWFSKNIRIVDLEMYFEKLEPELRKSQLVDLGELEILKRIQLMNLLIEKRGKIMIAHLNEYMKNK